MTIGTIFGNSQKGGCPGCQNKDWGDCMICSRYHSNDDSYRVGMGWISFYPPPMFGFVFGLVYFFSVQQILILGPINFLKNLNIFRKKGFSFISRKTFLGQVLKPTHP